MLDAFRDALWLFLYVGGGLFLFLVFLFAAVKLAVLAFYSGRSEAKRKYDLQDYKEDKSL